MRAGAEGVAPIFSTRTGVGGAFVGSSAGRSAFAAGVVAAVEAAGATVGIDGGDVAGAEEGPVGVAVVATGSVVLAGWDAAVLLGPDGSAGTIASGSPQAVMKSSRRVSLPAIHNLCMSCLMLMRWEPGAARQAPQLLRVSSPGAS